MCGATCRAHHPQPMIQLMNHHDLADLKDFEEIRPFRARRGIPSGALHCPAVRYIGARRNVAVTPNLEPSSGPMKGRGHLKGSGAVGGVQPHRSGRKPRTDCTSIPRNQGRPKADLSGHVPAGGDDAIVGGSECAAKCYYLVCSRGVLV